MTGRSEFVVCPVCGRGVPDLAALAGHLVDEAERSEDRHVMWLNRHVTKHRLAPVELRALLEEELQGGRSSGDRVAR